MIQNKMFTYTLVLWNTDKTVYECHNYRMMQTVQLIRYSLELGDIDSLLWILGTENVADTFTKRIIPLQQKLKSIRTKNLLPEFKNCFNLDSNKWN